MLTLSGVTNVSECPLNSSWISPMLSAPNKDSHTHYQLLLAVPKHFAPCGTCEGRLCLNVEHTALDPARLLFGDQLRGENDLQSQYRSLTARQWGSALDTTTWSPRPIKCRIKPRLIKTNTVFCNESEWCGSR